MNPIIDPSTLTEEQRKAIIDEYKNQNINPAKDGQEITAFKVGIQACFNWLFGEELFEKGGKE